MADIINIPETPDINEAEKQIRNIAKFGSIIPSYHCFRDSMANRDYDVQDLEKVLLNGKINAPPEYDSKYNNWKFKVEGLTTEDDIAVVVTVIVSHRELFCITIFDK